MKLKLNFVGGKLQSVWCDDERIHLDGQAVPSTDQTGKPIGLYGVFNQEGTTNFWRTRFLE